VEKDGRPGRPCCRNRGLRVLVRRPNSRFLLRENFQQLLSRCRRRANVFQRTILVTKLDATAPGMRPAPREILERAFMEAARERYGGMSPVALTIAKEFGLDPDDYTP
jgi:hypothetical protein